MIPPFGKPVPGCWPWSRSACWSARRAGAAGLLIADGGFGGVLEIKEQDVHVTINNGVAVTEVDQVFVNTENRVVEALYTFPVPKAASVSNFSMWIDGKEMIGEVVEKQRARQIYESYKQTRRDPGLLEQVDYKRFEMRIFPIPAGAEQRVKLTYYQELDFDHDWATYVYPLATVSRTGVDQQTKGHFAVTVDVKSEVPIVEMESPSHGERVRRSPSMATTTGEPAWRTRPARSIATSCWPITVERPKTGFDVITSKTAGEDGFFQLSLTAGKELEAAEPGHGLRVRARRVGQHGATTASCRCRGDRSSSFIESLGPEDRFEVITFNIAPTHAVQRSRARRMKRT